MVQEDSLSQLGHRGTAAALQTENSCWLSWERKGFCGELQSGFLYVPHLCSCNCRRHLHALHHFFFHVRKLLSCSHLGFCMGVIAGLCSEGDSLLCSFLPSHPSLPSCNDRVHFLPLILASGLLPFPGCSCVLLYLGVAFR